MKTKIQKKMTRRADKNELNKNKIAKVLTLPQPTGPTTINNSPLNS